MALAEQINNDLKAALLGGDRFMADTLRNLKAAILNEEVSLGKRDEGLADQDIEAIIAREVKKRTESKLLYESNGRPELAEVEQKEIDILINYLPKQLSEDEVRSLIDEVVVEIGATDMKSIGQVIGAVKAKAGTAADGALVAKLVKQTLQN